MSLAGKTLFVSGASRGIGRPSRECTGTAFLCEDVLAAEGSPTRSRSARRTARSPR
jgi:hypothetical protein